ncbi:hypothetical protein [Paenibacillus sp. FSL R10-2736]|uniref:hypothetical protein n=1 Tax=Paenibacillus sp. FSL R10-2736 TaxID=2954692 RepID=UPI0030F5E26C
MDSEELLEKLEINRILFIDDEVVLDSEKKIQIARDLIAQFIHENSFRDLLSNVISKSELEDQWIFGELTSFENEEEKQQKVIRILEDYRPNYFKPPVQYIIDGIKNYFSHLDFTPIASPSGFEGSNEYDLIIMDYDYGRQFTALDVLDDLRLKQDKLYYIVFLSSHESFEYMDNSFDMKDPASKQDLFRKCATDKFPQIKGILNYINKSKATDFLEFSSEITKVLLELHSGKLMVDAITSVQKLLHGSVDIAMRKLLLSNTKTMKALMTDKLESEGASETLYLVDFSLSMIKNLVNEKVEQIEEIHDKLKKIQGWSCEIWDYETDDHLRDLRKLQLLDKSVNDRFAPIDFGDIFEISLGDITTYAILLNQSCDLVIRELQTDVYGRNDYLSTLILSVPKPSGKSCVSFRLGNEDITFDVRKNYSIPLAILDLVSLNKLGAAELDSQGELEKKFSWSNSFFTYMQQLIVQFKDEFGCLQDGNNYYSAMGVAYTLTKDGHKTSFKINRKSRLQYNEAFSVLKHYVDIKTRVPLMLDPSDEILLEMKVTVNKEKSEIPCFYCKGNNSVYINTWKLREHLEQNHYHMDQDVEEFFDQEFVHPEMFRTFESNKTSLLPLMPSYEVKFKEKGINFEIKDNKEVIINTISFNSLKLNDAEFSNDCFKVKLLSNNTLRVMLKKEEFILEVPNQRGIEINGYIDITNNIFNPKIEICGNTLKVRIKPLSSQAAG